MSVFLIIDIERVDEQYRQICEILEQLEYTRVIKGGDWHPVPSKEMVSKTVTILPFNVWYKEETANVKEEYDTVRRELIKNHFYNSIFMISPSHKILEYRQFILTER